MTSSRPPKRWFGSCTRKVKGTNKAAVCGGIWKRISPSKKARIRRRREGF